MSIVVRFARAPMREKIASAKWRLGQLRAIGSRLVGWDTEQWVRIVQIREWEQFLCSLPITKMAALEISPGANSRWQRIGFGSYRGVQFPDFDITKEALPETFDVIIAEHVFEHIPDPEAAARNVRAMLKNTGVFLIATPFLIRVHDMPGDYHRWTPMGMKLFLERSGFEADVRAWGNRSAVVANFRRWAEFGWGRSLKNEPNVPIVVWAYARCAAT